MAQHSPFHGISQAKCNTAWENMKGDDSVRTCPRCQEIVIAAEGLDESEVIRLVTAAEPQKKPDQLKLYRRADGKLMTGDNHCSVRALLEFYFSWPIIGLLILGYLFLALTAEGQNGYVISLANHIGQLCLLLTAVVTNLIDFEFLPKGKFAGLRYLFGGMATFSLTAYGLLRLFNIPVWTFAKETIFPYLGAMVVLGLAFAAAKKWRETRPKRNMLLSRQNGEL